jgi:hypothetical protein
MLLRTLLLAATIFIYGCCSQVTEPEIPRVKAYLEKLEQVRLPGTTSWYAHVYKDYREDSCIIYIKNAELIWIEFGGGMFYHGVDHFVEITKEYTRFFIVSYGKPEVRVIECN